MGAEKTALLRLVRDIAALICRKLQAGVYGGCQAHIEMILEDRNREPPCADPESFVRGGPTLTGFFCCCFLVDEGRKDPDKRVIICPPAKRHLNGFWLACHCWPTLNAGLVQCL